MVKALYVHAPDKSKGYREQQIDISYYLVGILPASLLNNLQNGKRHSRGCAVSRIHFYTVLLSRL